MSEEALFRFGVIADCQYADAPDDITDAMERYYRASLLRLSEAVAELNRHDLAFTVHLGDLVDRDPSHASAPLGVLQGSRAPVSHLLGNHDFLSPSGTPVPVEQLCEAYGMPAPWYAFEHAGWRFVMLNGNQVSLEACGEGDPLRAEAERRLAELTEQGAANAHYYNGGLADDQHAWLMGQLDVAAEAGHRAVVMIHHPLDDRLEASLWGGDALAAEIAAHPAAAAVLTGHHHAGNLRTVDGLPVLTMQGMVETPRTAYAIVAVCGDRLEVTGYGRQPCVTLPVR